MNYIHSIFSKLKIAKILYFFAVISLISLNYKALGINTSNNSDTLNGFFEIVEIKKIKGFCSKNDFNCEEKFIISKDRFVYRGDTIAGFRRSRTYIEKVRTVKAYIIVARHKTNNNIINIVSIETKNRAADKYEKLKVGNQYHLTAFSITEFEPRYHSVIYQRILIDGVFFKEIALDCCDPRIFKSQDIDGLFYKHK